MKKIFLFSALLIIACGQAEATCNIKDIAKRVNFNMPSNVKISTDSNYTGRKHTLYKIDGYRRFCTRIYLRQLI